MTEELSTAASALNAPEDLVERSARARAKATGTSVEDVLATWSGGKAPEPASAPAPAATVTPPAGPADSPAPAEPATAQPTAPVAASAPVMADDIAADRPVDSYLTWRDRARTSTPRWLAIAFVIIPLFGLAHIAGGSGGCQSGGFELAPDRVTGAVENCDGSPFEGRGTVGGASAQLSVGEQLFTTCAACHGANGGGGVGPALATLLNDFPSCPDQIEWVTLGSRGFTAAGKTTYSALGKPINGGMPAFGASLTAEQIASVVSYERIRFGGGEQDAVLADCGLVTATDAAPPADGSPTAGATH